LVTLNYKGAAVDRAEFASAAYRDIDDASGYLAHLGLVDSKEGIRVGIVGPGTPAALAKEASGKTGGLAAGDVVTAIGGTPVANAAAVETYLTKKSKPGDDLEIKVSRMIGGKATPLTFTATLTRRPVQIIRPEAHVHKDENFTEHDALSFLLTLEMIGSKMIATGEEEISGLPSLINRNWTLDNKSADSAQFSLILDDADLKGIGEKGKLKLIKRYKLASSKSSPGKANHLELEIEIQNAGTESKELAYRFSGPTGLPLEGWWYSNKLHREMWAGAGARDIAWKVKDNQQRLIGCPLIYSEAKENLTKEDPVEQSLFVGDQHQALDFLAGDTQFFSAALIPQLDGEESPEFARAFAKPVQDVSRLDKKYQKTLNNTFVLVSPAQVLQPGKSISTKFQVFLGPKDQELLKSYNLGQLIERGWPYASYPAWLLQRILHGFFYLTGNYGISIILLTVLVRSCMLPLSLRQAKSAAKMQELAPEMTKIKEKYKDDMEKQSAALRELYSKHNFNPFGGCLPVFLQLPIFVGLYRCLSVDIALRDADLIPGFFWASNLAGPDKLLYWKDWMPAMFADETGWLGPYLNVLPIVTCALFLVQQKLFTPPATDEASAMQQKMMKYMTIFMGVMFFKVPAGLCIYFITSSLWSIVERKYIIKQKPVAASGKSDGNKDSRPSKPSPNGSGGSGSAKKAKR
jgi:YidC/Oxa1 family membrane protein insertase